MSAATRPDPSNRRTLPMTQLNPPVQRFNCVNAVLNTCTKTAAAVFGTYFAEKHSLDFTPKNYGLDEVHVPNLFSLIPGVSAQETFSTPQTTPIETQWPQFTNLAFENNVREFVSEHPKAAVAGVVTLLTCRYSYLLSKHMPHATTRTPTAFFLAATTTYAVATILGYQVGPEQIFNATVNSFVATNGARLGAFVAQKTLLPLSAYAFSVINSGWPTAR